GERGRGGDGQRQDGGVVVLVVAACGLHHQAPCVLVQGAACCVGGQDGAVAGQSQPDGLGQAVHRVGGEHARAGTTGRAGGLCHRVQRGLRDAFVGGGDHRVDEVELFDGGRSTVDDRDLAGFHGATGDEDGGDVDPHGGEQHSGCDLVAVGHTHQCVGAVRVDHVFDGVGDEFATGQGVEHAAVTHGDAVVHGDGVELPRDASGPADGVGDDFGDFAQVDVAGDEFGEAVGHSHDGFAEVFPLHAGGAHEGACTCHVPAVCDRA